MYTRLCSWNNLMLAYRKASKGKRGQPNVAVFEHRLEENLLQIQSELREQSYDPGNYHSFFIQEPKLRLISAAPFRDRVVHHALCNQIEPLFERSFIYDSYANRVGKGTHRALDRAQQYSRRYLYVLQCDIRQFFHSIDHAVLHDILRKEISDEGVLWLCDQIMHSGVRVLADQYKMVWFSGDDLLAAVRPRGLPIGNLTSQFWANVYLNSFDHFVKRKLRCAGHLRYVDDFILFSESKKQLLSWKEEIVARLAELRLVIHPGAQPRPVSEGIPFLGFQVFPQKRRLKRRKGIYYQRKYARLLGQYTRGEIDLAVVEASVQGWLNHVRYGNTVGLAKKMLNEAMISKGSENE